MRTQYRGGSGVALAVALMLAALFLGAIWLGGNKPEPPASDEQAQESGGRAAPRRDFWQRARAAAASIGELLEQQRKQPSRVLVLHDTQGTRLDEAPAEKAAAPAVKLFNGTDLTNFYTYLGSPGKGEKPYGKNNDPEKVFSVRDGMIRISGKVFGGLITEKEYENYHLVAEFRWGEKTWPPRVHNARDSGILLHGVGPDGAAGGVWLESIECQMIEGGTGDFILVAGKGRPGLTVRAEKRGGQYYYNPKAEPVTLDAGRFNWFGRDPDWKDVKGFRGRQDVERQAGEWNRLECVCAGGRITNILNGMVVNRGTGAKPHRGKILFQSEGAEVFFRRIDLLPLPKGQ